VTQLTGRSATDAGDETRPPGAARQGQEVGAPTAVTGRHLPALTGLRGVAVAAVVAYHLQLGWASGGYLGVDLFFVLSGFLITTLLLEEWVRARRIDLVAFWGRRARRLLPALFLVVAALGFYLLLDAAFGGPGANALIDLSGLRGEALATLLYVNNWHLIYAHQSYFAQFSTPSPLQHTWSLAIEEQFYLVWPLVLLVVLGLARRSWRRVGVVLAVVLCLASTIAMAVLFHAGTDPSRVYYGTDTRLFDLMAGAALAFVVASRAQPSPRTQRRLHLASPLAGAALVVFWVTAGTPAGLPKNFMFEGGFLVCAVLAAVVVADARLVEPGRLSRLLALRPVHFLGTISYGVYLWHWPVIVYLSADRTGLGPVPLDLARIGATLALSSASYYLVERPIRRARLQGWVRAWGAPLAGVATAVIVVVATVPSVADPAQVAGTSHVAAAHPGSTMPGAGGYEGQAPIRLTAPITAASPLRVAIFGDSVMNDASFAIRAAMDATGEGEVFIHTFPGFGLATAGWRQLFPFVIDREHPQIILASWSWDDASPAELGLKGTERPEPNALHQPAQYAKLLHQAVASMLAPGDGVEGVIFTQWPEPGRPPPNVDPSESSNYQLRVQGNIAWNRIAESMTRQFPGRVMYLPVGASLLWHGKFATWLPPGNDPHTPLDEWVRVRHLDNKHLCPEGAARYSEAVMTDLTALFKLTPAGNVWEQGSWTTNPDYNTPPGSCPDDHPPA
jgi:peptidoglycan/LPS O-acetylase OafA/YrhL